MLFDNRPPKKSVPPAEANITAVLHNIHLKRTIPDDA